MALGTDYAQLYGQAQTAYLQGNFAEAAQLMEQMSQEFPEDPNVLLLRGHIYVGLQQYSLARGQYETVLQLTDKSDLIDYAQKGLEQVQQFQFHSEESDDDISSTPGLSIGEPTFDKSHYLANDSDFSSWQEETDDSSWGNHFPDDQMDWENSNFDEDDSGDPTIGQVNPFEQNQENQFSEQQALGEIKNWQETLDHSLSDFPFSAGNLDEKASEYEVNHFQEVGEPTFVVSSTPGGTTLDFSDTKVEDSFLLANKQGLAVDYPSDQQVSENEGFLANLDAFNEEELADLSKLDLTEITQDLPDTDLFHRPSEDLSGNLDLDSSHNLTPSQGQNILGWSEPSEDVLTGLSNSSDRVVKPTVEVNQGRLAFFKNASLRQKQWITAAAAGIASAFAVLLVSGATSLLNPEKKTGNVVNGQKKTEVVVYSSNPSTLLMALITGAAGFGTTLFLGQIATTQMKRSLVDFQNQFDAIYDGNFNVKATIYSEDELGQLAARFNQVSRVILTTTSEAQRRASETEQAKEDLQRQVIRLLDDVEGAARGDLTVEAEVTADVLGAVADSFNLTIQNLREIVRQVKGAAKQVNKGSTDSELFARNQSSDALRMAEELAVTLNSVQMMTESIQRVAENAKEAEEVARSSSVTALKGGEAVERTVVGVLQIRETVSETARKVKRLAEASQEISKIVALISQIASRTNLLALNASIQAARAGEAGRGFAIVADEVRQLADRSAKSLKEIEQIVLQIQSETGSVMTAMEEGIQQVIDVTERSEQAKKSLEDIIQVANHINTLVLSITADTVEQRENSRAVAQVMQSVELTAQETSQESQRVAGSLQNLVSISRDLLTSVERFRVDANENK